VRLAELAAGVPGASVEEGGDYDVDRVVQDSRKARPGDLFVALRGLRADGHEYAAEVAARGAAVALERTVPLPPGTAWIRVAATRPALGELAAELRGRPARALLVAGVTGTDGKTTTTHLAAHLLRSAGIPAGAMSTIAIEAGDRSGRNESGQTTVEAPEVQAWLAATRSAGSRAAILEVTSHALIQERVSACDFDVAAFTNVGRDHLDYHASWDDYLAAKARLLDLCAEATGKGVVKTAVLNADDASYERLATRPIANRLTYSLVTPADIFATDVTGSGSGSRFRIHHRGRSAPVSLALPAAFNVANALAAAGIALAFGLELDGIAAGIASFGGVPGRLERVDIGQPYAVYIDFAHSAGALATALGALRSLTGGRLLAVFGSTGRSDHDRPGMGRAAAAGADYFVITTDDPVAEDPAAIAAEVAAGAASRREGEDYAVILDRREAIRHAIGLARPGDTVLLAGKGHERFMLMARSKEPWDERAEAEAAIRLALERTG
jgi:UDP-N-acetylmuramoyl-L-alanyl-D-glutamate--2,6-diaminopimelate ligase